jgi:hypothetical protein
VVRGSARQAAIASSLNHTVTLAQGSIVFRPVRYPILLLGDVVTVIGIGLEWHGVPGG